MTPRLSRPRRSAMYVPAANPRAMAKVRQLDCDAVLFDLEDAVAPAMKAEARRHLIQVFSAGGLGERETVIRVNAVGTADFALDMDALAQCRPDAVLLPKVEQAEDLARLATACRDRALDASLQIWAMVETPAGLLALDRIVRAGVALSPALRCLVLGTNDLAKDTGVTPGRGRVYLVPWLMHALLVARRWGVTVLDGVWNDFGDVQGFDAEALQGREMGFDGKTLIHPSQIAAANRAFSATPEAVDEAQRIVAAFALPEHADVGVIQLQGKMVERLHLAQAERLLAMEAAIHTRAGAQQAQL